MRNYSEVFQNKTKITWKTKINRLNIHKSVYLYFIHIQNPCIWKFMEFMDMNLVAYGNSWEKQSMRETERGREQRSREFWSTRFNL